MANEMQPPDSSEQFKLVTKQNSKSRSFAEPGQGRQSIKLFGNSFGKGSKGRKHNNSFLSVNNPNAKDNKLSARSHNSGRGVRILPGPNPDGLSQVSESYNQSFMSHADQRNEVDLELIELMKQSQSQGLMDECAHIERISGADNDHTMKNGHGFTPVSFRHI